jgi:hypothetical protein
VLAGRVRVISEDVIQLVEEMRTALNHTAAMINGLRQRLEDFQILGQSEEEVLTREAKLSREKLADLETAIPALIQQVTRQEEVLAESVGKALAHVRFPDAVAAASSRSLGFFEELLAWSGAGLADAGAGAGAATAGKLDRLQSNYTMASERQVHASALQGARVAEGAPAASPGVELFDGPAPAVPKTTDPPEAGGCPGEPAEAPGPLAPLAVGDPLPRPEPPAANPGLGDNVELF